MESPVEPPVAASVDSYMLARSALAGHRGRSAVASEVMLGLEALDVSDLGERHMSARDVRANAMAMRDPVDPDGLGGFRVLIQGKRIPLYDVEALFPPLEYVKRLPMPVLRSGHVPLYEGTYPTHTWELEAAPRDE